MDLTLCERRKIVVNFISENPELRFIDVFNYFKPMKFPRSTVYDIFKSCRNGDYCLRKPGSGRKPKK